MSSVSEAPAVAFREEYRKQGGEWRIARMKITRLLIEGADAAES